MMEHNMIYGASPLTEHDIYLFKEGSHFRLYEKMGAHMMTAGGMDGVHFALWAPNAVRVSVIGEFNGWDKGRHQLTARRDGSGIWEGFIPGIGEGTVYKYHIVSGSADYRVDKGDPFAFSWETPPGTGSIICRPEHEWNDHDWMKNRHAFNSPGSPISIYEVHLGSWRRAPGEGNRFLTYREMAPALADYVKEMGYTHVEFLPVMEHPFYGSWGYQTVGYFAPTGRYGAPRDFMYLIDHLHRSGVGVILDWVPSHFPDDEHGLMFFDGTHLYSHADPRKGFNPEWRSYIFNYGRSEVRNFLVSSALFWLDKYHIDGIRVDAVASMLYLDYGKKEGEWIPNEFGGRENMEAMTFLRKFNEAVYENYPDVQTIAEESTDWPMVSRPVHLGGLGFGMKWNMGWMHDSLKYFSQDPILRKYHHEQLTFSIWYAFSENFVLPLSHDEVVYGKRSLVLKMPGDEWRKNANLRLLYGYMYGHPGKKLLFMGGEFGQWKEWVHEEGLEWDALQYHFHQGIQRWVKDLNRVYRSEPALYELDFSSDGFRWVDFSDAEQSIISFTRQGKTAGGVVLVVCNLTPAPRYNYRIGVPCGGFWLELLNSDAKIYGGSGHGNTGGVESSPIPSHGKFDSLSLTLPPLGMLMFKNRGEQVRLQSGRSDGDKITT